MNLLLAASEFSPLARTGGMGDAVEALAGELTRRGHSVSVVLPCYRGLADRKRPLVQPSGVAFDVPLGGEMARAEVLETTGPRKCQVFLIRNDALFDRPELYGEEGTGYPDNAARFIFFSKCIVELARRLDPTPDVLLVNDWQTALVPALVKGGGLPWKTVLTLHNIAHQGAFPAHDFGLTNLGGEWFTPGGLEFYGGLNLLKGGILLADALVAVSSQYAQEIQTPEFGYGLDAVVRENAWKLSGILQGLDSKQWNPAADKTLPKTYTAKALAGRKKCREELLSRCKLTPDPKGPILTMASRVVEQKGFDILLPCVDRLLAGDVRLVVLGRGDPAYEVPLSVLAGKHRGKLFYKADPGRPLSRLALAGGDILLTPSRFEPSGLPVMAALRYGMVPVARCTGGLYQILQDYDAASGQGNSFLFHPYSPEALLDAIRRAMEVFEDQKKWKNLVQQAMQCDFSWENTGAKLEGLLNSLHPSEAATRSG